MFISGDGSRRAFAHASGTAHGVARARAVATVMRADGTVETPGPSRLEQLYLKLEKGGGQSDLAKALKAWRSGPRDWGLLYHVYEIIKHDVSGGTNDYRALKAVTPRGMTWPEFDKGLERFRETGTDPALVGTAARHGKPKAKSISNPMPLSEAEDLIRRLLETWIKTMGC